MTILFWLVGGLLVFAIAAVAIGRVTAGLAQSPERAVFDADQSLEFVAEALPAEVTAQLSYDEVRRVLRLFHDHLHARGVATTAGEESNEVAVIDPETAADEIVRRASLAEITIERAHALAIIDAQIAYFEAIGVLGAAVDGPLDPERDDSGT
jgi:hypothetical protein